MIKKYFKWQKKVVYFYLLIILNTINPISGNVLAQEEKLKVGITGSPPFVITNQQKIEGISIEIWQEIAVIKNWNYEFVKINDVSSAIEAVGAGKLDILIGPISITPERIVNEKIEFSLPYFIVDIGVLMPSYKSTMWAKISPFFGIAVISSFGVFAILLFIVGNLMWLAEHRHNPQQFPPRYFEGIREGVWFALVTLTTVGYGDRIPLTKLGRLVAGLWMIITLLAVSSITAGLASAFTTALSEAQGKDQFSRATDLAGASIAAVSGTTGEKWAEYYHSEITETKTLSEAIDLVLKGQTEGVIFDVPALEYYLTHHPEQKIKIGRLNIATELYGFVVPLNSDLTKELDRLILELTYEKKIHTITNKWLKNYQYIKL